MRDDTKDIDDNGVSGVVDRGWDIHCSLSFARFISYDLLLQGFADFLKRMACYRSLFRVFY